MASSKKYLSKSGEVYYRFTFSQGRGKPKLYATWHPKDSWNEKTLQNKLNAALEKFDKECRDGKVKSRAEVKAEEQELKAEIERQRIQEEAEAERQRREENKVKTFRDYGERVYMPTKERTLAENTRVYYQALLDKHIYPYIGNIPINEVTPTNVKEVLAKAYDSGCSYSLQRGIYITMSQVLKMAYDEELIDRNPADKVPKPKKKKEEGKDTEYNAFTYQELAYIMKCLELESLKWRVFIHIMIDTGIRRGECTGLRWGDINLADKTIVIQNNVCFSAKKGVYETSPKNGHKRIVFISDATAMLLKELKTEPRIVDIKDKTGGYLFTRDDGVTVMSPQSATRFFHRFGQKYNVEDMHPHKLRHTMASLGVASNVDVASLSKLLGHAQTSTTLNMYVSASTEQIRKASETYKNYISELIVEVK